MPVYQEFHTSTTDDPFNDDDTEPEACSSPGPRSSSPVVDHLDNFTIAYLLGLLNDNMEDDSDDESFDYEPARTPVKRAPGLSAEQKATESLNFMRQKFSRFSLFQFLNTIFTSDVSDIKRFTNKFLSEGSHFALMDIWWDACGGLRSDAMADWVIEKAAMICDREASWLSNRASDGPHPADAKSLRVLAKNVDVAMVNKFRIYELTDRYDRLTPHLQRILKAVISKDNVELSSGSRNPDAGRTLVTSIALNLRSRLINYHATMNSAILWDARVPKRLVQAFNHLGVTASYSFQARAITALSRSAVSLARTVANDRAKIKMLPYDNFNWVSRASETSVHNTSRTHDEVSALLIVLPTPPGLSAHEVTSVNRFVQCEGSRHKISRHRALGDIIPSASDQMAFRANAIQHVQQILVEEIKSLSHFEASIGAFDDPRAIPPRRTEEYYLPTFDQEQSSTRGNMVVLEHYFGKVLAIPKSTFEDTMFTVLGDRLTTARDRAAQDQRAVDRSNSRFDRLSSFSMVSGLMHFSLNFIMALGRNAWGGEGQTDAVSLATLRTILPNREGLNLRKVDFYDWLRFLDAVLRSLVIKAFMQVAGIESLEKLSDLKDVIHSPHQFLKISISLVDKFLLPSTERLEADRVKTVQGNTVCGHAVLLMHDLMTLREMRHAVKHGHPTRVLRMIKYWLPMFYAAGSYNYASECMELLHNIIHDWPKDYARVALDGMLVNSLGLKDGFKEGDLRVEHLNDRVKENAHGSNATPEVLEKTTPAMGHVQALTDQLFEDLGVEKQNQRHAKVLQRRDVQILVHHLHKEKVFVFSSDRSSAHPFVDLYRGGLVRLSGPDGGHAKHLQRHELRLRTRHSTPTQPTQELPVNDSINIHEFANAIDSAPLSFTIGNENDHLANLVLEAACNTTESLDPDDHELY